MLQTARARAVALLGAGFLAVSPLPAFAEDPNTASTGQATATGSTTATRADVQPLGDEGAVHSTVASFASTKLKDSPAVVTVISQDEIRDSGARDLMDILALVPGFWFGVDNQNVIGTGFRGLWGYEGKMLLMIDGKEMNEQLFSTIELGNEFPVEMIERVEVVRGPGSVIYGGNAELAVINVITRSVQGSTDVQVYGTYGQLQHTYARRSVSLSGRYVFENVPGLSAFVSASIGQGQRADRVYSDEPVTEDDGVSRSASMVDNFHLDPMMVQAGIGYRDLQASIMYYRYHTTGLDGDYQLLDTPAVNDFTQFHAEILDTIHFSDRFDLTPRFNYSSQEPWQDTDPTSDFFYDKTFRRFRGRLTARYAPWDFLQFTGGVDLEFDRASLNLNTIDPTATQDPFNNGSWHIEYQNYAGFLEAYSENPIVNIVLGARYDQNSAYGNAFSPRVVLLRDFGPFSAKALFSKAFRAPGVENVSEAVSAIKPENTTVFELEATLRIGTGHTVSVNAFNMDVSNPIIYFLTEDEADSYHNSGRLGSRGIEASYSLHGSWGRLNANYSFYVPYGDNLTPDYLVPGHSDAFAALPTHKGTLSGTWNAIPGRLNVSPTVIVIGPRYQVDAPDEDGNSSVHELPTQVLLNLFVRSPNVGIKGLDIGAGVYNILGTNFQVAQPYNGGHAAMPVFAREYLLRVGYTWEPGGG